MDTNQDPIIALETANMSRTQITVVVIAIFLNALDGFDLLSISFAAPGIAAEWGISRASLGVVLSMELIGMGIGALTLGAVADKLGRRAATLICLALMLVGMITATMASGVVSLSIPRVITGIGLGGMLATCNAIVAEFSNAKRRRLCISLMVIGFSIGGVVGGFIATQLLAHFEWRSVFYFGSTVTLLAIPIVYFLVPESIHWLARTRPDNALAKINSTLHKMGYAPALKLPQLQTTAQTSSIADIFSSKLLQRTLLITTVYLLHAITFYFTLKWAPKIVVDLGYHPSTAGTVLVWANVGGALGGLAFGFLSQRFNLKLVFFTVLLMSGLTVIAFGHAASSLGSLSFFCALNGFFCVAGLAGSYATMAQIYPTYVRGFGTGFTLSIGRGGAICSPIIAGLLFSMNMELSTISFFMAAGSILAAIVLLFLKLQPVAES